MGLAALRERDFALYWWSRLLAGLAIEMQSTAVGWQVYRLTGRALDLGLIGLAQFVPFALLFLVTGLVADRFSRVKILALCVGVQLLCGLAFFAMSSTGDASPLRILLVVGVFGISRAFHAPVAQSIVPNLVPAGLVANAIAWNSSGMQISRIAGPSIAGVLIAVGEARGVHELLVYAPVAGFFFVALVLTFLIRSRTQVLSREPMKLATLVAGLRFLWTRQVIFAVTALDLFAVLFSGAAALLPIYAKDILGVGSEGFGVLRSALMVGAFTMALVLTQRPVARRGGVKILAAVAAFGAGVVVFGTSTEFWLSMAALYVMGAADTLSVNIRQNLVQMVTPDEMRGRVGAVVSVFVGASNELGAFEAGVTADWWGTVPAVVFGGAVTMLTAATFWWAFPVLRRIEGLDPDSLIRRFRDPHGRRG
jgi:MFS family permease